MNFVSFPPTFPPTKPFALIAKRTSFKKIVHSVFLMFSNIMLIRVQNYYIRNIFATRYFPIQSSDIHFKIKSIQTYTSKWFCAIIKLCLKLVGIGNMILSNAWHTSSPSNSIYRIEVLTQTMFHG